MLPLPNKTFHYYTALEYKDELKDSLLCTTKILEIDLLTSGFDAGCRAVRDTTELLEGPTAVAAAPEPPAFCLADNFPAQILQTLTC